MPLLRTYDEEEVTTTAGCCTPIAHLVQPVDVGHIGSISGYAGEATFWRWPLLGPLLFENESSDARDHCANERTFLSYLRLSVTMAIVSVAIVMSFHLKHQPTQVELDMARPLGAIFWGLSVVTLTMGVANYIKTVNKYSRRAAIVQSGWKTQIVMVAIAISIIGACVTLLIVNKLSTSGDE